LPAQIFFAANLGQSRSENVEDLTTPMPLSDSPDSKVLPARKYADVAG
jgi:hypothetical protein